MLNKKLSTLVLGLLLLGLSSLSASALSTTESTNSQYLERYGYSKEMIRMVNLQKNHLDENNESSAVRKQNRAFRFFKNLFTEADPTFPTVNFGERTIDMK